MAHIDVCVCRNIFHTYNLLAVIQDWHLARYQNITLFANVSSFNKWSSISDNHIHNFPIQVGNQIAWRFCLPDTFCEVFFLNGKKKPGTLNPGGNKSNIRVVFPEKVGNPGTVNLIFTDPMSNSLLVQKFQKLRGGIFYISINVDIPDVAREPKQQDHTKKEPGCKALTFLDSEQQKRQTSFF